MAIVDCDIYECKFCGFEKGIPKFLIEVFRQDILFGFGELATLEDESMSELTCPNCRDKFEYKKTENC